MLFSLECLCLVLKFLLTEHVQFSSSVFSFCRGSKAERIYEIYVMLYFFDKLMIIIIINIIIIIMIKNMKPGHCECFISNGDILLLVVIANIAELSDSIFVQHQKYTILNILYC